MLHVSQSSVSQTYSASPHPLVSSALIVIGEPASVDLVLLNFPSQAFSNSSGHSPIANPSSFASRLEARICSLVQDLSKVHCEHNPFILFLPATWKLLEVSDPFPPLVLGVVLASLVLSASVIKLQPSVLH